MARLPVEHPIKIWPKICRLEISEWLLRVKSKIQGHPGMDNGEEHSLGHKRRNC